MSSGLSSPELILDWMQTYHSINQQPLWAKHFVAFFSFSLSMASLLDFFSFIRALSCSWEPMWQFPEWINKKTKLVECWINNSTSSLAEMVYHAMGNEVNEVYEMTSFTAYHCQHSLKSPPTWQQHKFKLERRVSTRVIKSFFVTRALIHQLYLFYAIRRKRAQKATNSKSNDVC